MIRDKVAAGDLPELEERLPAEVLTVQPTNAIGTYGGTLRGAGMAPETTSDFQILTDTGLYSFSSDLTESYPNLAAGHEFTNGNKTCIVKLRKGVKWSDSMPFTADDVMFFFEDWQFNTDLSPRLSSRWQPAGEPMTTTKVDDYTVQFDFAVPYPSFPLIHHSGPAPRGWTAKHFMEQFHQQYNPKAEEEAKAGGFDNWQAKFGKMSSQNYGVQEPELPVLDAWAPVKVDSQRINFERNPYYMAADTEGNQLPYIDNASVEFVSNMEMMNLKAVSGELSMAGLDLLLANYPVLKEGEGAGNYRIQMVHSERGTDVALGFNQNHPDPVIKEIFNDVRFRQACSVAINRDEINELVFLGQGTPRQATINQTATFYKPEWGEHYAQYDVDLANNLLDEIGLDQKGSDGVRLRPDGQPMTFQLEYLPHEGPKKEVCELVVKYWAAVGLKAEAAARERSFLMTRLDAMEQDVSGWHVDRELERIAWANGWEGSKLGPGGNSGVTYCRGWRDWLLSKGESGVEPPQEAKDLAAAFEQWRQEAIGTPEYAEAGIKVHDLIAENLWIIGTLIGPQPVIVKNDLENVFSAAVMSGEKKFWWGAANWFWHTTRGAQWFFKV